ncbi:hypothetical protein FM112_03650 [Gulosibacter sp. 10]|nr:hypothetical protein FM112_03650 [Gulosibacter sp. 10]
MSRRDRGGEEVRVDIPECRVVRLSSCRNGSRTPGPRSPVKIHYRSDVPRMTSGSDCRSGGFASTRTD